MRNERAKAPLWVRAAATVVRSLPMGRYRAAHAIGRRVSEPFWTALPADLGRMQFRCDLRDALMREAFFTGRYEPQETAILQRLLRPGMTFADVGANWGYFTLVGAHLVGPAGRVISVEADPPAAAAVRANISKNALSMVHLFDVAASDRPGELVFEPYEQRGRESGNFGVAQSIAGAVGSNVMRVAARPLDALLDEAHVDRVDVLKMDIEGGEAAALRGLSRRLGSARVDRIVLELHPAALETLGTSMADVIALLRGHGYEGWRIDHSSAAHRATASGAVDVASVLSPLDDLHQLGAWPHVLWRRAGIAW